MEFIPCKDQVFFIKNIPELKKQIPNIKVIMPRRGVQLTCRIIVADVVRKDEYQKKLNYDAFEPMKKNDKLVSIGKITL